MQRSILLESFFNPARNNNINKPTYSCFICLSKVLRLSMESARSYLEIGTLPEEVLIKIFEYLCFDERRNIRCVCKYWNKILSLSKFTKDEVLRFKYQYEDDDEPVPEYLLIKWDITAKSRPFHKIILKIGREKSWQKHLPFYSSIGQETKVLEVKVFEAYLKEFDFGEFFKCFPILETLITDRFKKILRCCPTFPRKSLKHVHVPFLEQFWDQGTIPLLRDMEKVTADSVSAYLKRPIGVHGSSIFAFEASFNSFLERNRDCSLSLGDFNLAKDQEIKLSDVRAISEMPMTWLNLPLEKFDFLEKLHLDEEGDCADFHNGLNLPMPLVRDVDVGAIVCHRCLKALVASFPKADKWTFFKLRSAMVDSVKDIFFTVTELKVDSTSNFFQILKELNNDRGCLFQRLESLHIKNLEFEPEEECDWPLMPRLRSLELGTTFTKSILNKTVLVNIVSATPSVREFTCLSANIDEEDMRAMERGWPYLESLDIRVLKISEVEAKNICKNLRLIWHDDEDSMEP